MKTYELTSKTTSNGIKNSIILRSGDDVTGILNVPGKDIDA